MENILNIKNTVAAAAAVAGGAVLKLLGGWDITLQVLVGFMAADYITGLLVAGIFRRSEKTETGSLSSAAGFKGLARKCAVLLMVFLAESLDGVTGVDFIRHCVCLFFTANEGLSLLENFGLMGVPYPAFLKNMLEAMKKKSESGEEEKGD